MANISTNEEFSIGEKLSSLVRNIIEVKFDQKAKEFFENEMNNIRSRDYPGDVVDSLHRFIFFSSQLHNKKAQEYEQAAKSLKNVNNSDEFQKLREQNEKNEATIARLRKLDKQNRETITKLKLSDSNHRFVNKVLRKINRENAIMIEENNIRRDVNSSKTTSSSK